MPVTSCRRGLAPLAPRIASLAVALAAASGCGGSGSDYRVDLTASQVTFQAVAGEAVPPTQRLEVAFKGDGLLVGYAPGVVPPSWLGIGEQILGSDRRAIHLGVNHTSLPVGTHETSLRFVTGKADGSAIVYEDLAIRYVVGHGMTVGGAPLAFQAQDGVAPPVKALALSSDLPADRWTVAAEGGAAWLTLPATSGALQGGAAQLQVGAAAMAVGRYDATLVVRDANGTEKARVPVSYTVDGAYTAPDALAVSIDQGASSAALDVPIPLHPLVSAAAGAGHAWTLTSDQPWVTVHPAAGDLSADVTAVARLDADQLWALPNGARTATLTLAFTSGGGLTKRIPVQLDLALQPRLVVPEGITLSVSGAVAPADLVASFPVTTNLGEAFAAHGGWTASTAAAWLAASGDGASGGSVELAVRPAEAGALPDGLHLGSVTVLPADARLAPAVVTASLDLHPAAIASVTPHAGYVGQAGEVVLRGTGFGPGPTLPVDFGGTVVTGRVVGPTEVRAPAPAQGSPGPVAVSVPTLPEFARAPAERLVLSAPGYLAHRVEVPFTFTGFTLDPERQAVILSGYNAEGFRRLQFRDGAWSEATITLPRGISVGLSADGKDLITVASGFYDSLTVQRRDPETLAVLATETTQTLYAVYGFVAGFNDGRDMLLETDQWSSTLWFPGLQGGPGLGAWGPIPTLTRDRSRLIVVGSNSSGLYTFDAGASAFVSRLVTGFPGGRVSASGDGGRMVTGSYVYDRDFTFLGALSLPTTYPSATAVSPDGALGYAVHFNSTYTAHVWQRADLTAAAGPYAASEFTPGLEVPAGEYVRQLEVSDDGGTLFVLTFIPGSYSTPDQAFFYALPLP